MSDGPGPVAVLRPARIGVRGMAARRRLDRRNLAAGVLAALLMHLVMVGSFWLIDRWRIREIGEWSGPILVKIGAPDAPESSRPDPGPQSSDTEVPPPDMPVTETPPADAAAPAPASGVSPSVPAAENVSPAKPAPVVSETAPSPAGTGSLPSSRPAAAPRPAQVKGDEDGNSYVMNFDGSDGEVGRIGAYDFISSYMPLPDVLDRNLVEEARTDLKGMNPEKVRELVDYYWELEGDKYYIKDERRNIPMGERPHIWSILINSLQYNVADAEWRQSGLRPVVVEFTVGMSQTDSKDRPVGAELSDIKIRGRTNDPRIDEAVEYGIQRWVYYNKTDHPVKGRIIYSFDDAP